MNRAEFSNLPEDFWERITPTEWAYLAGMIDGEGTITLSTGKRSGYWWAPVVTVSSTHLETLHWLRETFHLGYVHVRPPKSGHSKPYGYWAIHGRQVVPILENCVPHLRIKRERALLVLAYQRTSRPRKAVNKMLTEEEIAERRRLVQLVKTKNKRGAA